MNLAILPPKFVTFLVYIRDFTQPVVRPSRSWLSSHWLGPVNVIIRYYVLTVYAERLSVFVRLYMYVIGTLILY